MGFTGKTVGWRREGLQEGNEWGPRGTQGAGNAGLSVKSAVQSGVFKVQGTPARTKTGQVFERTLVRVWVKGNEFVLSRKL